MGTRKSPPQLGTSAERLVAADTRHGQLVESICKCNSIVGRCDYQLFNGADARYCACGRGGVSLIRADRVVLELFAIGGDGWEGSKHELERNCLHAEVS